MNSTVNSRVLGQFLTRHRFRFLILTISTLCLTLVFSNMISVNFTIICMDPEKSRPNETTHFTLHHYSNSQKTILQWSVSIASMVATVPFSYVCTRYGAQHVFFVSGLISALSTALIPIAAKIGFLWFVLMRTFQGIAYACDFAVIGLVTSRWASLSENAIFLAVLTTFPAFSNIFTNSISGVICDSSLGWPSVHYVHSFVTALSFVAWFVFYTDRPEVNRFVSSTELLTIHESKSEAHKKPTGRIPYFSILKNKVVWSVWLNAFTDLFASFFFILYGPTYNHKVLKFDPTNTGIVNALDYLTIIPVKFACGYASDKYNCLPEKQKMRLYNSLATLIPAVIFVVVCFVPTNIPIISVVLFGISNTAIGCNCGGYYKCGSIVSRQYAEFVIAMTQFIKCAVFFIAPLLVEIFVHDETVGSQWHPIFWIMSVSLVISNGIFCFYATDQPADFTKTEELEKFETKQIHQPKLGVKL
ncbi:hypothetical protein M3Y94_01292800 [Aphelenchoides besseyi]|nr:hypothetical protein M3Y94_01292800 [Aphelenchoides besseyi]KAI6217595.1 Major Facilitator Superfamily protein [Aphelenchoides besseyi]